MDGHHHRHRSQAAGGSSSRPQYRHSSGPSTSAAPSLQSIMMGANPTKRPKRGDVAASWKLIVDPMMPAAMKRGVQHRLYRWGGLVDSTDPTINAEHDIDHKELRDPRNRFTTYAKESRELRPTRFVTDDEFFVGQRPVREVSFFSLNDNVSKEFLTDMCAQKLGVRAASDHHQQQRGVRKCHVYCHKGNGRHLGCATVWFYRHGDARFCAAQLNGKTIMGRKIVAVLDPDGEDAKRTAETLSVDDRASILPPPPPPPPPGKPTARSKTASNSPPPDPGPINNEPPVARRQSASSLQQDEEQAVWMQLPSRIVLAQGRHDRPHSPPVPVNIDLNRVMKREQQQQQPPPPPPPQPPPQPPPVEQLVSTLQNVLQSFLPKKTEPPQPKQQSSPSTSQQQMAPIETDVDDDEDDGSGDIYEMMRKRMQKLGKEAGTEMEVTGKHNCKYKSSAGSRVKRAPHTPPPPPPMMADPYDCPLRPAALKHEPSTDDSAERCATAADFSYACDSASLTVKDEGDDDYRYDSPAAGPSGRRPSDAHRQRDDARCDNDEYDGEHRSRSRSSSSRRSPPSDREPHQQYGSHRPPHSRGPQPSQRHHHSSSYDRHRLQDSGQPKYGRQGTHSRSPSSSAKPRSPRPRSSSRADATSNTPTAEQRTPIVDPAAEYVSGPDESPCAEAESRSLEQRIQSIIHNAERQHNRPDAHAATACSSVQSPVPPTPNATPPPQQQPPPRAQQRQKRSRFSSPPQPPVPTAIQPPPPPPSVGYQQQPQSPYWHHRSPQPQWHQPAAASAQTYAAGTAGHHWANNGGTSMAYHQHEQSWPQQQLYATAGRAPAPPTGITWPSAAVQQPPPLQDNRALVVQQPPPPPPTLTPRGPTRLEQAEQLVGLATTATEQQLSDALQQWARRYTEKHVFNKYDEAHRRRKQLQDALIKPVTPSSASALVADPGKTQAAIMEQLKSSFSEQRPAAQQTAAMLNLNLRKSMPSFKANVSRLPKPPRAPKRSEKPAVAAAAPSSLSSAKRARVIEDDDDDEEEDESTAEVTTDKEDSSRDESQRQPKSPSESRGKQPPEVITIDSGDGKTKPELVTLTDEDDSSADERPDGADQPVGTTTENEDSSSSSSSDDDDSDDEESSDSDEEEEATADETGAEDDDRTAESDNNQQQTTLADALPDQVKRDLAATDKVAHSPVKLPSPSRRAAASEKDEASATASVKPDAPMQPVAMQPDEPDEPPKEMAADKEDDDADDGVMRATSRLAYDPRLFDHIYHQRPKTPELSATAARAKFRRRPPGDANMLLYIHQRNGFIDAEDEKYLRQAYLSPQSARLRQRLAFKSSFSAEVRDEQHQPGPSSSSATAPRPAVVSPSKRHRKRSGRHLDELDSAEPSTVHKTGCARTEGYYKLSKTRIRASTVRQAERFARTPLQSQQDFDVARKSAMQDREARNVARRLAAGLGDTDSELLKVNNLKFRKKMIKFGRSLIHGWGLFSLQDILPNEMIIEYVGELVRAEVANRREEAYSLKGIGSSYLFRIDDNYVVDATKAGSMARFINHSCQPTCYARVITAGGQKRIVIYSKEHIYKGDEITYDYKFPFEDEKIPCLCGAPNCRKYLN